MSTKISKVLTGLNACTAAFALVLLGVSASGIAQTTDAATSAEDKSRTSISLHHVRGGRDNPSVTRETVEEHPALITSGRRDRAIARRAQADTDSGVIKSRSSSLDFWFFDADVILFNDDDNDGFYHGIDLLFDVDTNFASADVFAVLFLSFEGGPFNEYAETDDFTIFGASSDDEFVLVSELMSGYPTGSYDILIEIYDAFDGTFLTSFGPEDTSALSLLALEDFDLDTPIDTVQVVVNQSGGGGAFDGWLLMSLFLLFLGGSVGKIWRHRNDALTRIDTSPNSRSGQGPRYS